MAEPSNWTPLSCRQGSEFRRAWRLVSGPSHCLHPTASSCPEDHPGPALELLTSSQEQLTNGWLEVIRLLSEYSSQPFFLSLKTKITYNAQASKPGK